MELVYYITVIIYIYTALYRYRATAAATMVRYRHDTASVAAIVDQDYCHTTACNASSDTTAVVEGVEQRRSSSPVGRCIAAGALTPRRRARAERRAAPSRTPPADAAAARCRVGGAYKCHHKARQQQRQQQQTTAAAAAAATTTQQQLAPGLAGSRGTPPPRAPRPFSYGARCHVADARRLQSRMGRDWRETMM